MVLLSFGDFSPRAVVPFFSGRKKVQDGFPPESGYGAQIIYHSGAKPL
jgi:hypothetical protein